MPEIKAEPTTWKVLKSAQDGGHEISRDLGLLLGSTIKQGLGPGQRVVAGQKGHLAFYQRSEFQRRLSRPKFWRRQLGKLN